MKKVWISLLLVMVLALSTCAFAEPSGKLVIWEHTAQFEEAGKAVIAAFQEKYPDVEVDFQVKTSDQYYNLLATAFQAEEAPDLFWTNGTATTNMPAYAEQGLLMDLTDKLDHSIFSDTTMKIATVDGKVYSSPTASVDGRAVFYNKDIFAELGLEIPKTFDEFEAMLPVIKDAGYIPISFAAMDPWNCLFCFEPVLAATALDYLEEYVAGNTVAVNDPRVVAAMQKMVEWGEAGYFGVGYTGVDGSGAVLAFSKGEAAMCIDGTWNIATINDNNPDLNYGAFQIPTADGTVPFVGTSANGFSVNAKTQNEEAALAFVNFFASLEGQSIWVNTLNVIPCISDIETADPVVNDVSKFDIMTESWYNILVAQAADGEAPGQVWEEDQTKVFSNGITVEDFLNDLQSMEK